MSQSVPEYYFGTVDSFQNKEIHSSYCEEIKQITASFLKKGLLDCRVLDVGSGNGAVSLNMATRAAYVKGVEIVPSLYERAEKQKKEQNISNVDFVLGSVYELGIQEEFDLALFLTAIEHVKDHQKAIENILKALKPGGLLYLTAPNKLWPIEQHYNLPFLSWLPLPLANFYVRLFRKANSFEDASYSLTYFGMKKLLNRFQVQYQFVTPHNVDAAVYGCGQTKTKQIYRFAKWLLDRFPQFWIISKGFIIVIRKNET